MEARISQCLLSSNRNTGPDACNPLPPVVVSISRYGHKNWTGLVILHGDGTHIAAVAIGANCWISQQVAIGYMYDDRPTIGDNVTINSGAKVLGKVTVGDNELSARIRL